MIAFSQREILDDSFRLETLGVLRKQYGIDLDEIEKETKISKKYLTAIEQENFDELPAKVYTKNFIRQYAEVLGQNPAPFLEYYNRDIKKKQEPIKICRSLLTDTLPKWDFIITPKLLRNIMLSLAGLVLFAYLGFKVIGIISPPVLEIERPVANLITYETSVEVKGKTEQEASVEVNGQRVLADQEGKFSIKLDLQEGINIVKISSFKKYSRANNVLREILVLSREQNAQTLSKK